MNKKLKGFSLAELLISLLIISIVLSAAIPTLTKKSGANREFIWSWSTQNNSAYFGTGANQSAIVGYDKNPIMQKIDDYHLELTNPLKDLLYDNDNINSNAMYVGDHSRGIPKANLGNVLFNGNGDKLILLKKPVLARNVSDEGEQSEDESMYANSHITFYTLKNNTNTETTSTNDIKYAGRITMDPGNIAVGMGTLQNQKWDKSDISKMGENTAVGHFALLRNSDGIRNTAVGKKTLSANETGSYNTALGFGSLYKLGAVDLDGLTINSSEAYLDNTAVGVFSQMQNSIGKENTSVGAHSLKHLYYSQSDYTSETKPKYQALGNSNTAVGAGAMEFVLSGNENTAVGLNACSTIPKGSNNICIGANAGTGFDGITTLKKDNFGIYIGTSTDDANLKEAPYLDKTINGNQVKFSVPLISGHTRKTISYRADDTSETNPLKFHQELNINAKQVVFRPFDGRFDAFKFESMVGAPGDYYEEGYGTLGTGEIQDAKWGRASFNLRDTFKPDPTSPSEDGTSVQLQLTANGTGTYTAGTAKRMLYIDAHDPYLMGFYDSLASIYFNKMLKFEFPYRYKSSEYNDLTKRKFITARIDGVGLDTSSGGSVTEKAIPVVINDKLTVRNEDYEPSMVLKSGQFYLGTDNSNIQMNTKRKNYDDEVNPTTITNANKSEIIITQNETNENKFEIYQKSGTKKFMISQGTDAESAPRLQMDEGAFIVENATFSRIKAGGGAILLGTSEDKNDICYGSTCLNDHEERIVLIENKLAAMPPPSSDIRLKNVISDNSAGLKEINALEVKNYTFKNDKAKTPHVGVIAQQLQKIFPNAVTKDKDGYLMIRTEDIFYAMVNSIKDLFKQIQDLTAKITGLDKRLTELEKQNQLLQEQNKLLKKQNKAIEKRLAKLEKKAAK